MRAARSRLGPALSIPYEKTVLANGIRVVTGPMTGVKSASLIFYYGVGSRYEPAPIAGVAHFLEHMLFKGTPEHPKGDLDRLLARYGASWNAFTNPDVTCYFETIPAERYATALELEADRMRNTAEGLAAALRGLGTGVMPSLWNRLEELTVAVDLVVGERDLKFRAIAERMQAALPDARLHVVPSAGHAVQLEVPGAVADVLAGTTEG